MRKNYLFVAFGILAFLATVAPAAAKPPSDDGAAGNISLTVHAHSSQFTDTLFPSSPLPFPVTEPSTGTYSSIPCSRPAPFNDTALDFTPDYPGIDDPASVRHFVEATLTPTRGNQGTRVRSPPSCVWTARSRRTSSSSASWGRTSRRAGR